MFHRNVTSSRSRRSWVAEGALDGAAPAAARNGTTRQGSAWHSSARRGAARYSPVRHGPVGRGVAPWRPLPPPRASAQRCPPVAPPAPARLWVFLPIPPVLFARFLFYTIFYKSTFFFFLFFQWELRLVPPGFTFFPRWAWGFGGCFASLSVALGTGTPAPLAALVAAGSAQGNHPGCSMPRVSLNMTG